MLLSLQEEIWRTAATLTLTYFVGWGLKIRDENFATLHNFSKFVVAAAIVCRRPPFDL